MRDADANVKALTGETRALHSHLNKSEQAGHNLPEHNADMELDKIWHSWNSTFDAIKDSIILTDGEFKIIRANLASLQLFGKPLDQIIGKTCWQLVHSTNNAPEECPLKKTETTKKHEHIELYLPEKGIWVEALVNPVFDRQGNLIGTIHVIRDITDRKQTEKLLRQERDRAQKYLDVARVMFVAIDAEQRVCLINKKGCEILGYSEEEVIAKNWFDNFVPEKIRNQVKTVFEKNIRGELSSVEYYENPILARNGDQRLIAWHNTVLRDEEGRFIATLSSGEDITERKEAEEALRAAEERFSKAFHASPDAMTISRMTDGVLIEVNEMWEKTLGYSRAESVGISSVSLGIWCDPAIRQKAVQQLQETGSLRNFETDIRYKTGKVRQVSLSSERLEIGGEQCLLTIIHDITERKEAEQKLTDYQMKLKSLASQLILAKERERHRLATELHDRISQALVISKIKLDTLRKSGCGRKLDKGLEDICNSISQTIQDTRALTLDLGSPVLHELGFETAVSEWLTGQIQKKHGITVEFEDDGEPKPLDEDIRILLFRDVRELLTNVVKHAKAKKVKVSIRKAGSKINIRVEDDGCGFDTKKEAAAKMRGFGLFSIRERLGQLGGHLEIESEPGRGIKATLVAPLKQEKENRKGKQ